MILLKLSPKVLFLFLSIVMLTSQSIVSGVTLKCEYHTYSGFAGLDGQNVYYCDVRNNGIFTDERATIDSVEGEHKEDHKNTDVNGFHVFGISSLKLFPQNLQNIFRNILVIRIFFTDLQEINQNDIKVFPNLKYLYLGRNKITSIDADLFEFNPELRYIALHMNQISHIDPSVFDHLNSLRYLRLKDNKCKKDLSDVEDSRSDVLNLIIRIKRGYCVVNQCLANYESCESNLTSVASQKSALLEFISELQKDILENEKKIEQLRDENKQIQIAVDELKTVNGNMTNNEAATKET